MAKSLEKKQALALRRKGKSIKEIARTVKASRGSVSVWCREIVLTDAQRKALKDNMVKAGHKGRMLGAEMNKQKKIERQKRETLLAKRLLGKVEDRDRFMMGVGLYWGEGVKAANSTFAVVNSDPAIISFMKQWFEDFFEVPQDDFRPYIYISTHHRSREHAVVSFWSTTLRLSKEQCSKVVFLNGRPKKLYENHHSYYGILALRVRKSSHLKYRMLALIEAAKQQILPG